MFPRSVRWRRLVTVGIVAGLVALGAAVLLRSLPASAPPEPVVYRPRQTIETSGFLAAYDFIQTWGADATLEDYGAAYQQGFQLGVAMMDQHAQSGLYPIEKVMLTKCSLLHAQGEAAKAYETLEQLQGWIKGSTLEQELLYTIIYFKGVTALRMAENDNCVMCRGESACIFPISPAAVHTNPRGSRLAVEHFTEYLRLFPDDLEVKWLLNLAHMTLGEYPTKVDPRHRLKLGAVSRSEFDIGAFRDVSHQAGLERLNQSGGGLMDDFDNDGLFDIVVTDINPSAPMAFYRNKGDGTFEDRTRAAGLEKQLGALYCVQTDYNNDGHLDIFIPRGSWFPPHLSMRPSLLRNNGNGTFTDVTREAGLLAPVNSTSATWADYDNDGHLDLFICDQQRTCKLYRNKGDGTFEEVAAKAGLPANLTACLGAAWVDYDNDGYPDLFVNLVGSTARLYHNNRNGTFTDVTKQMGIEGPIKGFSCWAFDFDNDGWLDILATTAHHTLEEIVKGLLDQPHNLSTARLYRNLGGKRFQDVTKEAGLDKVYTPMGSNFGDLDNDGYLDFYLGTGSPDLATLVPNRLFKNVAGKRFAEITASSRTGHLQKGHSVAIGDWRRCGSQDIFIQLGGAVKGDRYHNVLFQNPGNKNNWLSVKLVGKKTNRAAIGARIKVVTEVPRGANATPLVVHRHVSSGSSFGANPLEQHIGLGKASRVALLEVHWPTSGTTQVFRDVDVNQGIVITEFATDYQKRSWKPIAPHQ